MTRMHALLIGIDCYMPNTLPQGLLFGHLGGCVRDINMVEAYLNSLTRKPDRSVKLMASGRGEQPAETDRSLWPTYVNLVNAFKDIIAQANAGDLLYIHYSGHGVRTNTTYAEIKGAGQLDEGLVPTDYGQPGGNYLRDIQLAYLIEEMLKKQLRVTLVLDSCHSGGATRGMGSAVPRGVPGIDRAPREADDLVATRQQLATLWQTLTQGGTRAATSASGWLVEPKGYTLLAACRANEEAYEDFFGDGVGVRNGALTYWWLDSLRTLGTGISYKRLHDRLIGKIRGWKETQTPQLQGEGNWVVFGEERVQSRFAIPVLGYDTARQVVTLNAGEVHGLGIGSQLAVYPSADSDFTSPAQRLAIIEITELKGESDALARVVEQAATSTIDAGNQAVLLGTTNLRLQRTVRMAQPDLPGHAAIETAIQTLGAGFIRLTAEGDKIDFQVATNDAGNCYELWDGTGDELPNLRPALPVDAADAAERVAHRLLHLAKYRNVQMLDNPASPLAGKLRVELIGAPIAPETNTPVVASEQTVTLRIHNDLPPNPHNPHDATRTVNVTVLDLQGDWGISQLFPAGSGDSDIVPPQGHIDIGMELYVPEGYTEQSDIFKVFATQKTTNFQWLTLPVLDEPLQPKGVTRGQTTDPLEQLLEAVSGDELTAETVTRAARLSKPANQARPWTVAEVKVLVKKA